MSFATTGRIGPGVGWVPAARHKSSPEKKIFLPGLVELGGILVVSLLVKPDRAYFLRRRSKEPIPTKPVPSSVKLAGSGVLVMSFEPIQRDTPCPLLLSCTAR